MLGWQEVLLPISILKEFLDTPNNACLIFRHQNMKWFSPIGQIMIMCAKSFVKTKTYITTITLILAFQIHPTITL